MSIQSLSTRLSDGVDILVTITQAIFGPLIRLTYWATIGPPPTVL
jgi:hypothetical protein